MGQTEWKSIEDGQLSLVGDTDNEDFEMKLSQNLMGEGCNKDHDEREL